MSVERTMHSILSDLQPQDIGEGKAHHQVVDLGTLWSQGRATYGGLIGAIAARAGRIHVPEDRRLTAMQVTFAGPLTGNIGVTTELLRAGRSASLFQSRIENEDKSVGVVASTAFGLPRDIIGVEAPQLTDLPDRAAIPSMPTESAFLPGFLKNMEIKWVGDGIPLSGSKDTRVRIWVRMRENLDAFPTERMVALADMPPPVILSHFKSWAPASSMTWGLDFVVPPEAVTSEWIYYDYRLVAAKDGYTQQSGRIYDEDGRLVALSNQTMTYFEPRM